MARAKSKFAESEKRVSRIPSYIESKLWTEGKEEGGAGWHEAGDKEGGV